MSIIKSIIQFLGFDSRKTVYTPLNEEEIKTNEKIKALAQKVQSQQSQLARVQAKEKEKQDREKERDKESEVNKKLKEQELDLKAKKYGKKIKLSKFYKHLLADKKFKNKLEICDKNDEVVLGKFGDFVILEGGNF